MSRLNVGTISIGVIADGSGVGPAVDKVNKELARLGNQPRSLLDRVFGRPDRLNKYLEGGLLGGREPRARSRPRAPALDRESSTRRSAGGADTFLNQSGRGSTGGGGPPRRPGGGANAGSLFGGVGAAGRGIFGAGSNLVGSTFGGAARAGGGIGGALAGGLGGFAGSLFGSAIGGIVGNGLAAIADKVSAAAGQVVSTGIHVFETAAVKALSEGIKREDSEVSFGALLGSAKRGKGLVDEITKLAIDTPFGSSQLLDQSKLLVSYGVAANDLIGTLRRLGDVSAGTGTDLGRLSLAYGQTLAKGRLQGGELRQFTEAGVGVGDFVAAFNESTGKKVGVNQFLKLSEDGQVSSRIVEKAFERMTSAGGRFFGLMDDRGKTFGGRLQALRESLDVFAGKIGKSFIDNTGAGQFLDDMAKRVQGADTGGVDNFFRGVDRTVGPFAGRLGRGFGGLLGGGDFAKPNFETFDKRLNAITNETIPSLLDAGRDLGASFLEISSAGLRVADVLGHQVGSLLDNLGLRGDDRKQLAEGLKAREKGQFFDKFTEKALRDRITKDEARMAERNAAIRAGGGIVVGDVADGLDARARALRASTPGDNFRKAAQRPDGLLAQGRLGVGQELIRGMIDYGRALGGQAPIDGQLVPDKLRAKIEGGMFAAKKVLFDPGNLRAAGEANRLNKLAVAEGRPDPGLNPGDVLKFNDAAAKTREVLGSLNKRFDDLAEKAVPGFGKSLDDLNALLAKPREDRPLDAFRQQVDTANFGRLKGFMGLPGGLGGAEADRAKFMAFDQLRDKVRPKSSGLGEPPPLLRANTQEAESALTRSINEGNKGADDKPTMEKIQELLKEAAKIQEASKTAEEETTKILREMSKNQGGFNFMGIGFGGSR